MAAAQARIASLGPLMPGPREPEEPLTGAARKAVLDRRKVRLPSCHGSHAPCLLFSLSCVVPPPGTAVCQCRERPKCSAVPLLLPLHAGRACACQWRCRQ